MTSTLLQITRRGLPLGGQAALVAANLPCAAMAQDSVKMAGSYTVPVEQQRVRRIHIATEVLKPAGAVDDTDTENVTPQTIPA